MLMLRATLESRGLYVWWNGFFGGLVWNGVYAGGLGGVSSVRHVNALVERFVGP